MARLTESWVLTADLIARAEAESTRLFEVVREGNYSPEWPVVSWLMKTIAGGRCEHCGRRRRLAVHHLDRDKLNLQHWNLVALCWDRCHLWVETHLSLDRDQLDLFGGDQPVWLTWRLRERAQWPRAHRPAPAPSSPTPADDTGATVGAGAGRPCACGCGRRVSIESRDGRPRLYFSGACQQRVYRERRLRQLSLFAMPPP